MKTDKFMLTIGMMFILVATVCYSSQNLTESDAESLILKLEKNISILKTQGFSTTRLDDSMSELWSAFNLQEYDQVAVLSDGLSSMISTVIYLDDLNAKIIVLIEESNARNLNTTEAQTIHNAGLSEFQNNNFEEAQVRLEKSYEVILLLLKNETTEIKSGLSYLVKVTHNNSLYLARINSTLTEFNDAEKSNDFAKLFIVSNELSKINHSVCLILEIRNKIRLLQESGYSVDRMNDELEELQLLLEDQDYSNLVIKYNQTSQVIDKIVLLDKQINETKISIEDPEYKGVDFTEAEYYLNQSITEFLLENYEKSEEYLGNTIKLIDQTKRKFLFTSILNKAKVRLNIFDFIRKNWLFIVVSVPLIVSTVFIVRLVVSLQFLSNKAVGLEKEQGVIHGLIKKLQLDYFKDKVIDKETYSLQYNDFETRITHIKEELPLLNKRLDEKYAQINSLIKRFPFLKTIFNNFQDYRRDKNAAKI